MAMFHFSGDLLLWDLAMTGQQKWQPFSSSDKRQQHNRIIFNMKLGCADKNLMATTSMDRQVSMTIFDIKKVIVFISNLDIFPLILLRDIVSINLTDSDNEKYRPV